MSCCMCQCGLNYKPLLTLLSCILARSKFANFQVMIHIYSLTYQLHKAILLNTMDDINIINISVLIGYDKYLPPS